MKLFVFVVGCFIFHSAKCKNEDEDKFLYFAYGSNLLSSRMHVNCPSAEFYSVAKLLDYRLDFNISMTRWNGAVATICYEPGSLVWGVLWKIDMKELPELDKQEGVKQNLYYAKEVNVIDANGTQHAARVYIEYYCPALAFELPAERQPSQTYFEVILLGAIEAHLPANYLNYIRSFKNNRQLAPLNQRIKLGYPFYGE